ncbi:protein TALPID3 [Festucalex cinctus]
MADNLETLERARTGDVLQCRLAALVSNSEWSERARVKRTVDAWIHLIGNKAQASMESATTAHRKSVPPPPSLRPVNAPRGAGSKRTAAGRGRQAAAAGRELAADESYLASLYGRAPLGSVTSPVRDKPRPRAADGAKGAELKSCQLSAPARRRRRESSHPSCMEPAGDVGVAPTKLPSPPVAIPLAHPRIGPSPRTVTSLPVALSLEGPPAPEPPSSRLSPAPVEDGDDQPLEDAKVDSPAREDQSEVAVEAGPPPSITVVEMAERKSEEDEGGRFPGTRFLSVADLEQEESIVGEEEEALHLDGAPPPPPALYQGPPFPPEKRTTIPPPRRSSAPNLDDDLLERMVQWVEQQLMSRMIAEHFPPPPPVLDRNDQSDSEGSSPTSDIVEAAGGGGLQFFVDAGVQVDSPLVRELVQQVLAEMIDQALVPSQAPVPDQGANPGPGDSFSCQEKTVAVVITPLATPVPSPVPSVGDPVPLPTPPPSEPTSSQSDRSPQPIVTAASERVSTPVPSPEPSPAAVHQVPSPLSSVEAAPLLLGEEAEHPDSHSQHTLEVREEKEDDVRTLPPEEDPRREGPQPPASPSDDITTTSSSSSTNVSTVTGSDTGGLKPVSEGELLISFNHADAMTEEASSSSSLQDVDLDPPSEGQVKVHMTKMVHTLQGERSLEEELSSGEVTPSITPQRDGNIDHCAGQAEVSIRTAAPPGKALPSSDDSSDVF